MAWVSSGSEVQFTKADGTEIIVGYFDKDIELPDPQNDIKQYPSFGYGNRLAKVCMGKQTLNGSLPVAVTDGRLFYYTMANSDDTDSYTVADNLDGTYTHTIKPTIAPTNEPFGLKAMLRNPTFYRAYNPMYVASATFSMEVDEPLRVELATMATGVEDDVSTTIEAGTQTKCPWHFYQLESTINYMGINIASVESAQISWDNAAKEKHYFTESGERTPATILRGLRELTVSLTVVPDDSTLYGLLDNSVPLDTTIAFESDDGTIVRFKVVGGLQASAPHGLSAAGDEVVVELTCVPMDMYIEVVDTTTDYRL